MNSTPLRRVAAAVLLLALSACTPTPQPQSGVGSTEVATGGARFRTADADTAALGSDAAPGTFPRTVKHATGTVTITARPQRVVVLDTGELDATLSLGVTPVGMATTQGANAVPSYLADRVSGVEHVGDLNNLNLEKIAALRPDLILGSKLRVEKLYPQLSQIAPTVLSIRPGFPWKENLLLAGDALGLEAEATASLNAYARKADEVRAAVPAGTTVSLVRFMPGKIRLYAKKSLIGVILDDAGIARPAGQDVDELATEISAENIGRADGSWVFYSSYGAPDATGETSVVTGGGWKAIPAVAAGRAKRINDDVWFMGLGPTGAGLVLQELGEVVAGA